MAISPGLVHIALYPLIKRLPQVFTITAMGFFLFSFQVHEKSILLPLLPATLSIFSGDEEKRKWTIWINLIGTIRYPHLLQTKLTGSLWPLLKKDGLVLQYFIFTPLWIYLAYESLPANGVTRLIHVVFLPVIRRVLKVDFCGGVSGGTYCRSDGCGPGTVARYTCSVELDHMLGMFYGLLGMVGMGTLEGGCHNVMEPMLQCETENAITYLTLKNHKTLLSSSPPNIQNLYPIASLSVSLSFTAILSYRDD